MFFSLNPGTRCTHVWLLSVRSLLCKRRRKKGEKKGVDNNSVAIPTQSLNKGFRRRCPVETSMTGNLRSKYGPSPNTQKLDCKVGSVREPKVIQLLNRGILVQDPSHLPPLNSLQFLVPNVSDFSKGPILWRPQLWFFQGRVTLVTSGIEVRWSLIAYGVPVYDRSRKRTRIPKTERTTRIGHYLRNGRRVGMEILLCILKYNIGYEIIYTVRHSPKTLRLNRITVYFLSGTSK